MKRNLIRDRRGEGYIDVALVVLVLFTLMASLMALFPLFTAQQSLSQTAKYLARTVELYGMADDATLVSVTESGELWSRIPSRWTRSGTTQPQRQSS